MFRMCMGFISCRRTWSCDQAAVFSSILYHLMIIHTETYAKKNEKYRLPQRLFFTLGYIAFRFDMGCIKSENTNA